MRTSLVLAAVIFILIIGCDSRDSAPAAKPAAVSLGFQADCVICAGHTFDVLSNTPAAEHDGTKYYFCSEHCRETFSADPATALATYAQKRHPATQPTTAPH